MNKEPVCYMSHHPPLPLTVSGAVGYREGEGLGCQQLSHLQLLHPVVTAQPCVRGKAVKLIQLIAIQSWLRVTIVLEEGTQHNTQFSSGLLAEG